MLLPAHEQVFAYLRTLEETTLLVLANLSGTEASADLGPEARLLDGELVLAAGDRVDAEPAPDTVVLGPWESRVLLFGEGS